MPDPVRVAVVDSGVHIAHPHIDPSRLLPGFAVGKDGSISDGDDAILDRLGHGTAVTAAIQDQAPDALCLPIRVFHDALSTNARALIVAIDRAVEVGVDIINLSLGTINPAYQPMFEVAAERALAVGTLIVSAWENQDMPCYPGRLSQVLGVVPDPHMPRDQFGLREKDERSPFFASPFPRSISGVPQQHNLYGVSFAVANMAGIAANSCARIPSEVRGRARPETLRALLELAATEPSTPAPLDALSSARLSAATFSRSN
jgi:hypothetical protein